MKWLSLFILFTLCSCVTSKERHPSGEKARDWHQEQLRAIEFRR